MSALTRFRAWDMLVAVARKKTMMWASGALLGAVIPAVFFWPTSRDQAGYPFARRIAGEQPQELWQLPRADFEARVAEDTVRLDHAIARMHVAVRHANANRELLSTQNVETLDRAQRDTIRGVWSAFVEPLLALDAMKHRYYGWWGVDYLRNPDLHSMAYGLSFAALCAQVDAGHSLLELVEGNSRVQALFDEAMPEYGLPAGTFRAVRAELSRVRDQSLVPIGAEWFREWISRHLRRNPSGIGVRRIVYRERGRALRWARPEAAVHTARNKTQRLQSAAFSRWLPLQTGVAEWFGDTRVVPPSRRLISDEQLTALASGLRPGDIIVERRNWYLSNVGLPGFWPHAALYVGTQAQIRESFDSDPAVRERFGTFSEHLARSYPRAWAAFGQHDHEQHDHVILEAVSEGVVAASLHHSCGADYVAALRPRRTAVEIAAAIDRAFSYFGRPYDFNFDFGTDDRVVCSELVMKAYEGDERTRGIDVPPIRVAGRRAIPPTEIVRTFARERAREDRQLDFVYFLDGEERAHRAFVRDGDALAASAERPKWDVVQP